MFAPDNNTPFKPQLLSQFQQRRLLNVSRITAGGQGMDDQGNYDDAAPSRSVPAIAPFHHIRRNIVA